MTKPALKISCISKSYGDFAALQDVDVQVEPGEFVSLVGPSGCGKSTLLRLVAGLLPQTSGKIELNGRSIDGLPPKDRGVAMVFQNYALYPHMSVFDNLAMPLVMRQMSFWERFPLLGRLHPSSGRKKKEIERKVLEVARLLEIEALLSRRPGQLSGGQRQRVALGRAIVRKPALFLMDEPLSNLDARLRVQMRSELSALHRQMGFTFVYVTHDQIEAMTMSQRIVVMMDGKIAQAGTPAEVYARPATLKVAKFIGSSPINTFSGTLNDSANLVLFKQPCLPLKVAGDMGRDITVAIRPEDIVIAGSNTKNSLFVKVSIKHMEDHGADILLYLIVADDSAAELTVRIPANDRTKFEKSYQSAGSLTIALPLHQLHIFDEQGKRLETRLESSVSTLAVEASS